MWPIKRLTLLAALLAAALTWTLLGLKLDLAQRLMKALYDDSYLQRHLKGKYHYLQLDNGSFVGPRDYYNFERILWPDAEYFKEVNAEKHYFNELKVMEVGASIATRDQWHYSNKLQMLHSSWPQADESNCIKHLDYLEAELKGGSKEPLNDNEKRFDYLFENGFKNIQLLRFIDSWGRPVSDTYQGHAFWTGSYRSCLRTKVPLISGDGINNSFTPPAVNVERVVLFKETELIEFRYCWAKLRAKSWPQTDELVPPVSILVGVCLPNSCDTNLANAKLRERILALMKFNFSPMHKQRFNKLTDVYCLPTEHHAPDYAPPALKLFKLFVIGWLALVLVASVLCATSATRLSRHLKPLSIQENYNRFASDDQLKEGQNKVDFRPLNVLRLFCSFYVVASHVFTCFIWAGRASSHTLAESLDAFYFLYYSGFKVVDVFLVITGLLTSYLILKKFPPNNLRKLLTWKVYLFTIFSRYLRWAPTTMLLAAFMKVVYPRLVDSPYWDYGTSEFSMQGKCQTTSWWRMLMFPIVFDSSNNYLNDCLPPAWYMICDLKLSLLTPLVVYLMVGKEPKRGVAVALAAVIVSSLSHYKDLSMQKIVYFKHFFTYGPGIGLNMLSLAFGEPAYFSALNRLHGYALGLLAGLTLYRFQEKTNAVVETKEEQQKSISKKPAWMSNWLLALAVGWHFVDLATTIMSFRAYLAGGELPSEESLKLGMVLKPRLDTLSFTIIVLRLTSDLAPKVMKNFGPLYKLGKLSFCVYLVHTIIISYVVSEHEESRFDTIKSDIIKAPVFIISASFLIAFPLHLLFEAPMNALSSSLLSKVSGASNSKLTSDAKSGNKSFAKTSSSSDKLTTSGINMQSNGEREKSQDISVEGGGRQNKKRR